MGQEVYAVRCEFEGEMIGKTPTWKDTIRRELQNHNIKSKAYRKNAPDLFRSSATGIWGLKKIYIQINENKNSPITTEYTIKQYKRNQALPKLLRNLYDYTCQVSRERLSGNGKVYAEVHHIKPLHKGGLDLTSNMIVVTPNVHVMLDRMMRPIDIDQMYKHDEHKIDRQMIEWHNQAYKSEI